MNFAASIATAYPLTSCIESSFIDVLGSTQPSAAPQQKLRKLSDKNLYNPPLSSQPSPSESERSLEDLHSLLWKEFTNQLDQTTNLDSAQRFATVFRSLQPIVLDFASSPGTVFAVKQWTEQCSHSALEIFIRNRDSYHACPNASPLLGTASSRMYKFVREELHVPFLRTSMLRDRDSRESLSSGNNTCLNGHSKLHGADQAIPGLTTGGLITTIYEAIRAGALYIPVMECLAEAEKIG